MSQPPQKPPRARAAQVGCPRCGKVVQNAPFCNLCGIKLRTRTHEEACEMRNAKIADLLTDNRQQGETANRHGELADLHFKNKDYEGCIPHAQRAVALDPKHTWAWCLYIRSLVELGRKPEAEAVYRTIPRQPDKGKTEMIQPYLMGGDD